MIVPVGNMKKTFIQRLLNGFSAFIDYYTTCQKFDEWCEMKLYDRQQLFWSFLSLPHYSGIFQEKVKGK